MPVRKRRQKGLKVSNLALYCGFSSDIVAVRGLMTDNTASTVCSLRPTRSHKHVQALYGSCSGANDRRGFTNVSK